MREKRECPLCGRWDYLDTHHVFEGVRRPTSERLGLTIDICRACHGSIHAKPAAWTWLKERTQRNYMKAHDMTEDEWIEQFGRSWLKGD